MLIVDFRLSYPKISRLFSDLLGLISLSEATIVSADERLYGRRRRSKSSGALTFARMEVVPFTNNTGKQSLRLVKIKQKAAMRFRTQRGAKVYARFRALSPLSENAGSTAFKPRFTST